MTDVSKRSSVLLSLLGCVVWNGVLVKLIPFQWFNQSLKLNRPLSYAFPPTPFSQKGKSMKFAEAGVGLLYSPSFTAPVIPAVRSSKNSKGHKKMSRLI